MGLLPDLAADLLPGLWSVSHARADAGAGWLVTAYAAGVVVGAPTIAVVAARFPRRRLLLALLAWMVLGTLASALLPSFGLVLAARFFAGLPHGAYFGVATLVAAEVLGPGNRGRAAAWVISGLTISNVLGVPTVTLIGQLAGWRIAYLVVAVLFLLTALAVALAVPRLPGDPTATPRRELSVFTKPQVWLTLGVGAIGFGGFFSAYAYIAPLATNVTGLPAALVPVVLIVFGIGMTAGNAFGGAVIDSGVLRAVVGFFLALMAALLLLALTAATPVGLFLGVAAVGFASAALSPAIQVRLMDVAHGGPTIAAAVNHSSLNIGNALGAALGGLAIGSGFGYVAPLEIGVVLAVVGLGLAGVSIALDRRSRRLAPLPA
jgi:DHA1 family inner membrane transport protein